ncbi:MAG: hypothetical protein O2894_03990 [Planctomycetota bacterium]|nr:hypothetical protein [Planctomycetota bacterium]
MFRIRNTRGDGCLGAQEILMHSARRCGFVLALAIAIAGLATASSAGIDYASATASGVSYTWHGDVGELTVVGEPGTPYAAYDANGALMGAGALREARVSFVVGSAGVGPGGVVIYVVVDGDVVAVTDPDWNWD